MRDHDISQRRACRLVGVDPKTVRRDRPPDHDDIRAAMREIAGKRRRFGYRRIGVMLERKGMKMNAKKLYRIYREEGLAVKRRRGRKRARGTRMPMPAAARPNMRWSSCRTPSARRGASASSSSTTTAAGRTCAWPPTPASPVPAWRASSTRWCGSTASLRASSRTTSYVGATSGDEGERSPRAGFFRHGLQRDPSGFRRQGSGLDHSKRRVRRSGPDRPQYEIQNQAEDPNIVYGIAVRPDGRVREGSSRLAPSPSKKGR
jgi:hypothetical protein